MRPRQGERRAKKLDYHQDTGQRAISYPDDQRLRDLSNRSYNKQRTNRYGRVLFGKTSVSPNVVREEIRHLNRSYNKKRTNRYGRVLFENEAPRHWTTSDITSQMSKTLGLQQKNNEEARKETRRKSDVHRLFLYDGSTYER